MRTLIPILAAAPWLALAAACERSRPAASEAPIIVFAAASATGVMERAGRGFEAAGGGAVAFSFDSSSSLARQIEAGAAADLFLSADEHWMDHLAEAGLIRPGTRETLLANELVLVAPQGAAIGFTADLAGARRIAVGDPAHVPAGRYAKQALESLGWWDAWRERLVPALDVRSALRLVELGEADAGIVYATDAKASARTVVVGTFPPGSHEPIRYPIASCATGANPEAAADFVRYLRGPEVTRAFEDAGFRVAR